MRFQYDSSGEGAAGQVPKAPAGARPPMGGQAQGAGEPDFLQSRRPEMAQH